MTGEEKAEEYVKEQILKHNRDVVLRPKNAVTYIDELKQAYIDGMEEGRKEKQKIVDTQTVAIESRDVYLAEKESIIIRQQTEIQNLEKEIDYYKSRENAELKEQNKNLCESLDIMNNRENELLDQIEKMKCCENCSEPCWNPPIIRRFECIYNNHSLWELAK